MEQLGYAASRNTQENKDFREQLEAALDIDKDITPDEAKILTEKYEAVRDTLVEWKAQILAITHEELLSFSEGLGVDYPSVWTTIKKLYDVSIDDEYLPLREDDDLPFRDSIDISADEVVSSIENNTPEIPVVEDNVITTNDVIKSPQEAAEILKKLDRAQREYLQVITGAYPDGIIWAGTKEKLNIFLEKHSLTLNQLLEKYDISEFHTDFDYDEKMSEGTLVEVRENFKDKYAALTSSLENQLGIPLWINNAIARKESFYFTDLNSWSGSKWGMQLTKWPFEDMRWFWAKGKTPASTRRIRNNQIEEYQEIFQMIDFNELKWLSAGNGKLIEETLPATIWEKLETIWTTTPENTEVIIAQLQWIIKWISNQENYLHTLNIILWDVYFKYLYQHETNQDTQKTARRYNNDDKVAYIDKDWNKIKIRDVYAETVVKYMESEN